MGIMTKIFGTRSQREVKRLQPLVDKIEALEPQCKAMSDGELRGKTQEFQKRYQEGETLDQMLSGRALELPVFYDWETVTAEEGRANGLDGETVTACAAAFCQTVAQAGYTAGVYFNRQMGYHTYDLSPLGDYTFWLAEPGKSPTFYYHAALWQYDHSGIVPGIDTAADRNLLFEENPS